MATRGGKVANAYSGPSKIVRNITLGLVGFLAIASIFIIALDGITLHNVLDKGPEYESTTSNGLKFTTVYNKGAIELVIIDGDIGVIGTGPSGGLTIEKASRDLETSVFAIDKGVNVADDPALKYLDKNRRVLAADWDYRGTPGKSRPIPGFGGRTQELQVSNVMGGDAYINNANVVRASAGWCNKAYAVSGNNPNMAPANIVAHMKAVEHFYPISGSAPNRGDSGPVGVVQVPLAGPMPMAAKWGDAFTVASGFPRTTDYTLEDFGFTETWQMFGTPDGRRSYTFSEEVGILNASVVSRCGPVSMDYCGVNGRKIKAWANSEATRLIFDTTGDRPRCTGFHFVRNGIPHVFRAKKAVALHAGNLSPRLLQISGIGDTAKLVPLGIEMISHLPRVSGAFWSNHIAYSYILASPSGDRATDSTNANFTCTMGGFFPNPYNSSDPVRKIQIIIQDGNSATDTPVTTTKAITVFNLQPESRGSQTPMSASLNGPWNVTTGYFDNPIDIDTLLKFHNTTMLAVKSYMASNSSFSGYTWTNPSAATMDDPDLMRAFLVANARHAHHGSEQDIIAPCEAGGVVDPNTGLVCGVDGLFHVDTSTILQPDGNNEHYVLTIADIYTDVAVQNNWWV